MAIELSEPQGRHIRDGLADVKNYIENRLTPPLTAALGPLAGLPRQITEFSVELVKLDTALKPGAAVSAKASIPEALAPVLGAVAAYHRRRFVSDIEDRRARAIPLEILEKLDAAKAVVDELLKSDWYQSTKPLRLPRLSDFVAKDRFDRPTVEPQRSQRQLDDKFRILWSASEFWGDLSKAREECEERSAPVALAFVDVDGLKKMNTDLGEPWVDALIFPPLMRCIERTVFGKGFAYRYGGDEFVLLVPSADQEVAVAILRQLRGNIATTRFERTQSPTISIGLCLIGPDSPLTDREALVWAARAKADAKKYHAQGKQNVIVVVRGEIWIDRRDVIVMSEETFYPETKGKDRGT
jgi:diguanylate cyclase (GGDEF)-like protein